MDVGFIKISCGISLNNSLLRSAKDSLLIKHLLNFATQFDELNLVLNFIFGGIPSEIT